MRGFGRTRRFESFRDRHPLLKRMRRILLYILAIFVLYELVSSFILSTYRIESVSMRPLYEPGNRVFASPLWYGPKIPFRPEHLPGLFKPKRGEIVVLRPPFLDEPSIIEAFLRPFARFFSGQKKTFSIAGRREWENDFTVKRVVALPGDTVRIRDGEAYVRPEGTPDFVSEFSISMSRYEIGRIPLPEGWEDTAPLGGFLEDYLLKDKEYYVLGDNRSGSTDSRLWGAVHEDRIAARVLFRYWPPGNSRKP